MRKILLFLFVLLINLSGVISLCNDGQININNADATQLDKLSGIGQAYANAIINSRPFNSIDNLVDVKGIGPVTLEKIKTQGLACVEGEEVDKEKIKENKASTQEEEIEPVVTKSNTKIELAPKETTTTKEEITTIVLSSSSPKDIKSESDKEQVSKNKFAVYGLITFSILIVFLFGLKKGKKEKNEFK